MKVVPGRASFRDVLKGTLLKLYIPTLPFISTIFSTSTQRGLGIFTVIGVGVIPPLDELVEDVLLVELEEVELLLDELVDDVLLVAQPPEVLLDELVDQPLELLPPVP